MISIRSASFAQPWEVLRLARKIDFFTHIRRCRPKNKTEDAIEFTRRVSSQIIYRRLQTEKDYDDLLGTLLHAYGISNEYSAEFLSVCHQIVLFHMIGFLTTSASLSWIFVLLAQHPEAERQIAEEVAAVCHGGEPTYADTTKLTYTHAVVCEALRLYPPIAFILRQANDADNVMEYALPADASVLVNVFLAHRHPDYWSEPEKFNPERFLSKRFGQDYPYAYIPFGAGKRNCLDRILLSCMFDCGNGFTTVSLTFT